jgi:hypothetical protein
MELALFAGIPVTDYASALPWYEQLFGGPPSFLPNATEAVWEVAGHRYVYIVQDPGLTSTPAPIPVSRETAFQQGISTKAAAPSPGGAY